LVVFLIAFLLTEFVVVVANRGGPS